MAPTLKTLPLVLLVALVLAGGAVSAADAPAGSTVRDGAPGVEGVVSHGVAAQDVAAQDVAADGVAAQDVAAQDAGAHDAGAEAAAEPDPAFTLLRRAATDPWAVDRVLALPTTTASGEGASVPFRLVIEAKGATHSAVVMPQAPTPGRTLLRSAPREELSATGTVCLISRGNAAGSAEGWAATVAEAGAPLLESPRPHAALGATLVVRGEAAGPWFAEAVFPVRLLGPDGRVLAATSAAAQGDWMREAYVPFRAELHLGDSPPVRALLVLERANPSGLAENAGFLMVRLGCG